MHALSSVIVISFAFLRSKARGPCPERRRKRLIAGKERINDSLARGGGGGGYGIKGERKGVEIGGRHKLRRGGNSYDPGSF
jgi:hypothetical protein